MFNSILIAIDGSKNTQQILDLAIPLYTHHADVHVIYVSDLTLPIDSNEATKQTNEFENPHTLIQEALDKLRASDIQANVHVVTGNPAEQIVQHAEKVNAKIIIMGHRQLSKISRLFDPSTCIKVIENAPCPVLIARIKKD